MRKIKNIVAIATVAVMAFSMAGCKMIEKTPAAIQKTVLAKVGNEKITMADVNSELKSDIDLGIYCDSDLLLFIEEIENNTHTLLEFDFSDMNNIRDEFFIEQVEKEGILLYEKC